MPKPGGFFNSLTWPFKSRSDREAQCEDDMEAIAAQEHKQFSFAALAAATQDFSTKNKIGEGGFGPVYKGKLGDGREIAVKRLSHGSSQGLKEFTKEARLLARVQHRNVVNLLGYCAHDAEKLLVYEYVVNESLDKLLFDSTKRQQLDWKKRFHMIMGVARGLQYLHEDAHCCILHRDIKASNILLDDKWAPKIADFGLARLFPEDQTHVNTRVAGTNGYMAPEYAMHGRLSMKADVFSFGVVVLELVTGKKNSAFQLDPDIRSLLEWAWRHYKRGRSLEILDPALTSSAEMEQVALCIRIGLLCTQADPTLRPLMRRVVVMLSKTPGVLEEPTRPGFPGSRYRPSHRLRTGVTSSAESSSRMATSNSGTATTFTATISPREPPSAPVERRPSDDAGAGPSSALVGHRRRPDRGKSPVQCS